jgi:pimeloyl-ACP methyl ester carboxylesterase
VAEQRIGFATARDGVRIAYAASGRGPVLVIAPHWFSHLELEWDSPVRRHWLTALSARYTVIRYDLRGTGLSDRGVDAQSLEVWLDDLAAVLDTAAVEQCALLGVCQAGPIAVAFAARQPERVRALVLYGTYAGAGRWAPGRPPKRASSTRWHGLTKTCPARCGRCSLGWCCRTPPLSSSGHS